MPSSPDTVRPNRSSLRRFIERRVRFLVIALPFCCALLLIPWEGWLFELLRHFRLWCAVIGLALTLFSLLLRQWKWAAAALLTGLWQGYPVYAYRAINRVDAGATGGHFSVLTCNLLYEAVDPEAMIASLKKADADVIVFEEFTSHWQSLLQKALWETYPYRIERPMEGAFGICMVSRLPLENAGSKRDDAGLDCVSGVITVAGEKVGILGVHPLPPTSPDYFSEWKASIGSWPSLLRQIPCSHRVLTGDMNSTPFSRAFANLCADAKLRDSAIGYGLPNTWIPTSLPLGLPLDHVLVSSDLVVLSREVGPPAGSDHRWVKVVMTLAH